MKLSVTHVKKVPGQEDYSSEGFGATIEVQVPDEAVQRRLQRLIGNRFSPSAVFGRVYGRNNGVFTEGD